MCDVPSPSRSSSRLLGALLHRLRSERGIALPLALVAISASGSLAVSVFQFTASSGRTAHVAKGRSSADAFAEAGIANSLAVLNHASNNPSNFALLGCNAAGTACTPIVSTYSLGGTAGTATWSGWLDSSGGSSNWRLTSIGEVLNPTGGAPLRKTVTATVPLVTTNGTPNASVWNYAFSTRAPGSGCEVDLNGSNVVIDIPLYVTGDLCLSGSNSAIDERGEGQSPPAQPIDLRVGGKLVLSGSNATVGNPSDYLTSAAVVGGCTSSINGTPHPCTTADNYYVTTNQVFTPITAPTADSLGWFAQSATINRTLGGTAAENDCDVVAGSPPNINPDALFDADAGTVNLTPASSYTCRKTADGTAGGTVIAELSWNGTSTLTIKGAIVVDGAVLFNDPANGDNTYQGSATIHANGTFTMNNSNAQMCANPTCDFTTWNPNSEMLIMVATSITMNGSNNKWQGGLFCNPTSTADFTGSNVVVQGPVICGRFTFGSNTEFKPLPAVTQLPVGAPVEPNVSVAPGTPVYGG